VKKGQTRIDGIDDKIIGLYAAGLTVRDIQTHLLDLYGLKVSPDLISRVGEPDRDGFTTAFDVKLCSENWDAS